MPRHRYTTPTTIAIDLARDLHAAGTPMHIIAARCHLSPEVLHLALSYDEIQRSVREEGELARRESFMLNRRRE